MNTFTKHITAVSVTAIFFVVSIILIGLSSCSSPTVGKEQIMNGTLHQSFKFLDPESVNHTLLMLDTLAYDFSPYNPENPDYIPEPQDESTKGFCEMYDTASVYWNRLSNLCRQNNFKEADRLLNTEGVSFHISIFLKDPTLRYIFLDEVHWPILQEFEEPGVAEQKYTELLKLEYEMEVASMTIDDKKITVPEVLPDLINNLGVLLSKNGKIAEAFEMNETYARAILILCHDTDCMTYQLTELVSQYYEAAGETLKAIDTLEKYITLINDNRDSEVSDETNKYKWVAERRIKDLKETLPLIYAR